MRQLLSSHGRNFAEPYRNHLMHLVRRFDCILDEDSALVLLHQCYSFVKFLQEFPWCIDIRNKLSELSSTLAPFYVK